MGSKDGEDDLQQQQQCNKQNGGVQRTLSLSSNSSSTGNEGGYNTNKACVCAPTTHAGSFKCRLHRHRDRVTSPDQVQSPPPAAPVTTTSSSTRTTLLLQAQ